MSALSGVTHLRGGQLLSAVAEAAAADGTPAAVKVLLDGGRDVDEHQRYGVYRTLVTWEERARTTGPRWAWRWISAGRGCAYGDQQPQVAW